MTAPDKIILEEIINVLKIEGLSEDNCALWRAHCMENYEWIEIRDAWVRLKNSATFPENWNM